MKKLFTIAIATAATFAATAQDLNSHYLYQLNWWNVNPALTGNVDGLQTILNPGTQWTGIDGSPTNSMLGIHTPMGKSMGLGAKMVIDRRGLFTNLSAEALYSYKVNLNDDHELRFGVSMGMYRNYLNVNNIINDLYTDETDPTITSDYYNDFHLLASGGLNYTWKDLQVGMSAPHLVVSGRALSDHIFGMARYDFHLADNHLTLTPTVVFQHLSRSPNMIDGGVKAEWDNLVWVHPMYKSNGAVVFAAGMNVGKFHFGYAYNMSLQPLSLISTGSHEVVLGFQFDRAFKADFGPENTGKSAESVETTRLKHILHDLNEIQTDDNPNQPVLNEIKAVQAELDELIHKSKSGSFDKKDEKRMEELANKIAKLKSQLSK